jgi:hypothetical protein
MYIAGLKGRRRLHEPPRKINSADRNWTRAFALSRFVSRVLNGSRISLDVILVRIHVAEPVYCTHPGSGLWEPIVHQRAPHGVCRVFLRSARPQLKLPQPIRMRQKEVWRIVLRSPVIQGFAVFIGTCHSMILRTRISIGCTLVFRIFGVMGPIPRG